MLNAGTQGYLWQLLAGCRHKQRSITRGACTVYPNAMSFIPSAPLQGLSHYLEHMLFMGSEK